MEYHRGQFYFTFHLYINDIHLSSIKGNFITFAEDTKVIYAGKNLNDLTISVNKELDKIYNWLSANKLFLNINKTKYLIFHTQSRAQSLKESTINIKMHPRMLIAWLADGLNLVSGN